MIKRHDTRNQNPRRHRPCRKPVNCARPDSAGGKRERHNPLDQIAREMDSDFMGCGKTIATLFRILTEAALELPDMELYTQLLSVDNNRHSLTVTFHRDRVKKVLGDVGCDECGGHCGAFDEEDNEDEEERLYDEY